MFNIKQKQFKHSFLRKSAINTNMKCALLCCLLAFCGFGTVVSDRLMDQLYRMQFNSMEQVNSITNPILQQIRNDVNAAVANGKKAEPCYESARILMKSYVDPAFSGLTRCRLDAHSQQSISYANTCNNNIVSTFHQNAYTVRPSALNCISRL